MLEDSVKLPLISTLFVIAIATIYHEYLSRILSSTRIKLLEIRYLHKLRHVFLYQSYRTITST